jgi:Na+-translocating ferredoxin:NAD+ oxidoreductase subunit E
MKALFQLVLKENPVFILLLGLCPTLAVTTSARNGLGMGIASLFVLISANTLIALLRKVIPVQIRIPIFITIIASFVTMVDLLMAAFLPELHLSLGIFIPLIVVNCIILGRAEAYACKHKVWPAILDGAQKGLAFTFALVVLGSLRELLGNGSVFGLALFGPAYQPILMMILPPGAFILLGLLIAVLQKQENAVS